ncbi:unnamed protein product, partial [marine sediment metagenome]
MPSKYTGPAAAAEDVDHQYGDWDLDDAHNRDHTFRPERLKVLEAIILKHCPQDKAVGGLSSENVLNNLAKVLSESDPSENDRTDVDEKAFLRKVKDIVNDWRREQHCPQDKAVGILVEGLKDIASTDSIMLRAGW